MRRGHGGILSLVAFHFTSSKNESINSIVELRRLHSRIPDPGLLQNGSCVHYLAISSYVSAVEASELLMQIRQHVGHEISISKFQLPEYLANTSDVSHGDT
ncbi:hypothetical protein KC19_9G178500 [Ceratodon purpureus]|uniref:Uncharacterized protein n=1 Tax=Ceratodon purpureus TaxID=3225 RepID=A0A8T0GXN5_CERPU|nr:hypothetical protein KC19_9G178500 [Ceratodon purpureus]